MAILTVNNTDYDLDSVADAEETLVAARAIVETDAGEYRLANYDEMFGTAGSPIRVPESLPTVLAVLTQLTEAA